MTVSSFPESTVGWVALVTGIAGLLALAFIVLFFIAGQPFGTLNDICIGLTAVLSGVLAWTLYAPYHSQSPLFSYVALLACWVGAAVATVGVALVIFGITGWYLAGSITAAGNALIGLWLLGLNLNAQSGSTWPQAVTIFGIVIGAIMLLGLATLPGIIGRIDAWDAAPWYVNYVGQAGALGYLVLYPVWCIVLGRELLSR